MDLTLFTFYTIDGLDTFEGNKLGCPVFPITGFSVLIIETLSALFLYLCNVDLSDECH